ncbi:hypothetical protein Avbf_01913 [Armadillidium vulgare]|nr:hypothetical protein Avbf_01913 [Armadillidium vulgare]
MIFSALKDIYSKSIVCHRLQINSPQCWESDGKLIIFDIKELMPQKGIVGREKLNKPVLTISAHNDPIYSMASSKEFCITGATGVISIWWRRPTSRNFHLRSLALTTVFEPKETSIHVPSLQDKGASSQVNVCNISGEITAKILASSSCVYDVHVLEHPNTIAFIGGTGVKLDVCPNLNYRDHTVSVSE